MPQMAPLSWINLLVMFLITFSMMSTLNYFSFNYKSKIHTQKKKLKTTNWKW